MTGFCLHILGCKVNQYEGAQIAALLRSRGMTPVAPEAAQLHIIHTCSVTVQAAASSRQTVRRATRLPVLQPAGVAADGDRTDSTLHLCQSIHANAAVAGGPRVVVTGCWATSDPQEAGRIPGVDAVIGHHQDVASTLNRLLDQWLGEDALAGAAQLHGANASDTPGGAGGDKGWMINGVRSSPRITWTSKSPSVAPVKQNPASAAAGTHALPILDGRFDGHQRAFVKIQDGCDAHCTYCIIPRLRPGLWSKPADQVVQEVRQLVDAGHREIVVSGIFLGAYGQETALRRRQGQPTAHRLAALARAICEGVPDLRRLRFSSLEPGDLTAEVITVLRDLPQVVPHFHLPLQSGSDRLLRRMNRQYTRDQFLHLLDLVNQAFDRPALTTDIICGFPGETDEDFQQTLEVVDRARFIHIHVFAFSPRPGTAAARWTRDFVNPAVTNERIHHLRSRAKVHSLAFRRQFIGEVVEVLTERPREGQQLRRGRCPRYFSVQFEPCRPVQTGQSVPVRIDQVTAEATIGSMLEDRQ